VALEVRVAPGVTPVRADRDRLLQVLINLLSNAAKFAPPEEGRVVVSLAARAGLVRVSVADNGPGVRADEQTMIFEKFRQGGDTMTEKPKGTGLGLPISRQIIEHFGGRLWVESAAGEGATFVFELPEAGTPDPLAGAHTSRAKA
jgi:signal transduction histidine kinase